MNVQHQHLWAFFFHSLQSASTSFVPPCFISSFSSSLSFRCYLFLPIPSPSHSHFPPCPTIPLSFPLSFLYPVPVIPNPAATPSSPPLRVRLKGVLLSEQHLASGRHKHRHAGNEHLLFWLNYSLPLGTAISDMWVGISANYEGNDAAREEF